MSQIKLTLLSEEEIELIHNSSVHLLENCGMVVPKKDVLNVMKQYGAEIDYNKSICRFPQTLVEEFVKKSPTKIVFGARNPKNKATLEKGKTPPLIMPCLGAKYVNDLETRERRLGVLRDVEEFSKVIDALDHIYCGSEIVAPSDVPPNLAQYYSWVAMFKNTSKHLQLYQSDSEAVRVAIEMATVILGSERRLVDDPIISFTACIPEVLGFPEELLDGIVETARSGLPLFIESGPGSGATGPGTLAGTLTLANAELLGALTIIQILNPGTPVLYENYARHFDMKAENFSFASPEFILLRICQGQMARYYNIPSGASGLATDSKILDIQAGYEKSVTLVSILSGSDLIIIDSLDQADIVDLAEYVVNDELAAAYLRVWKGLEINEDTLAIEEIQKIGPGLGHNFLGTKHTMDHYRKEIWLDYKITERRKWDLWNRDGAKSAERRAVELAQEILKTHEPEPIPNDVKKELNLIIDRRAMLVGHT